MADTINISTGQGALGANDPSYTVSLPNGATNQATFIVPPNPGWGAQPAYNPTPGAANWIGPTADSGLDSTTITPGGQYAYTLTFFVTDSTIASVNGSFSSDNDGQVFLNGVLVPGDATTGTSSYATLVPFNLTGFVLGKNTLTFDVYNGANGNTSNAGGDFDGPTGLLVSATGSGISLNAPPPSQLPAVPEPGSIALLGTGLLSVAGMARRQFLRS